MPEIKNPLKHREYLDSQDIKDTIDDYMRETGDIQGLEEIQQLINAWRTDRLKKSA